MREETKNKGKGNPGSLDQGGSHRSSRRQSWDRLRTRRWTGFMMQANTATAG